MGGIPSDWSAHVGDEIVTKSFNRIVLGKFVPRSSAELTERVVRQAPYMLLSNRANVELTADQLPCSQEDAECVLNSCKFREVINSLKPYSAHFDSIIASADVYLEASPDILPGEKKTVAVVLRSNGHGYNESAYNLSMRWWLPEGFAVESGRKTAILPRIDRHTDNSCELRFVLQAGENVAAENRCVLEITVSGRFMPMYIPVLFLG